MAIRGLVALAVFLYAVPHAARAEWLYFKDGSVQEIRGNWTQRGRMIQFTTRAGVLQAIAAEEIDLPVSEALSKRARPNANLNEIRSAPDQGPRHKVSTEVLDVVAMDSGWDLVIFAWEASYSPGGNSARSKCVLADAMAVSSAGRIVVQIGTTIETVELYGLDVRSAQAVREQVEGRQLCLVQKDYRTGRDASGLYRAHALLADGRDVGLELIRSGQASPTEESHLRTTQYRTEFESRSRP